MKRSLVGHTRQTVFVLRDHGRAWQPSPTRMLLMPSRFEEQRADTAVRPYTDIVDETTSGFEGPFRRRDARWIVEWASLKAYPNKPNATDGKTSAGIGTHAEQPLGSGVQVAIVVTTGGRGSPPLHGRP